MIEEDSRGILSYNHSVSVSVSKIPVDFVVRCGVVTVGFVLGSGVGTVGFVLGCVVGTVGFVLGCLVGTVGFGVTANLSSVSRTSFTAVING